MKNSSMNSFDFIQRTRSFVTCFGRILKSILALFLFRYQNLFLAALRIYLRRNLGRRHVPYALRCAPFRTAGQDRRAAAAVCCVRWKWKQFSYKMYLHSFSIFGCRYIITYLVRANVLAREFRCISKACLILNSWARPLVRMRKEIGTDFSMCHDFVIDGRVGHSFQNQSLNSVEMRKST